MGSSEEVEAWVRGERDRQRIPGLSYAVVREGEVIDANGCGFANLELRVPATPESVYQIGSITKQFTAAAILMLIEEGKIGLRDPIADLLPDLPEAWNPVTLWHLLTHTSGIPSYTGLPDFHKTMYQAFAPEEIVALVSDLPLEFLPGEQSRYNNSGYFLLGLILEKAAERSYGEFLQERIFGPLGMSSTRVNDLAGIVPNRADGYRYQDGKITNDPPTHMSQPFSAGVLVSTVLDLAKWEIAVERGEGLRKSSFEEAWTPLRLNDGTEVRYGYGWALEDHRGHPTIGHGGEIPGFITTMTRFVEARLGVIVLTNLAPSDPAGIARGIAGIHRSELRPVTRLEARPDPDPERSRRIRESAIAALEGKETEGVTASCRKALASLPEEPKAQLLSNFNGGSFQFLERDEIEERLLEVEGEWIREIRHYRLENGAGSEGRALYGSFYLNAEDRIADVRWMHGP